MKTLREVIFERHQAAEPKLDAIREQVVAGLTPGTGGEATARAKQVAGDRRWAGSARLIGWREFLWSLRWHLAGMSAAWVLAALLSMDRTPTPAQGLTGQHSPSPQRVLAALRENQRQLRELIAAPTSEPAPAPPSVNPSPRSQIRPVSAAAA